ncbi:hypothetical protein MTO96_021261 [Rhipicephalus appendiculatus]
MATPASSVCNAEAASEMTDCLLITYPLPPARGVPIRSTDLRRLLPGAWLNDTLVEFGVSYILNDLVSEDLRRATHVFGPHFYTRLTGDLGSVTTQEATHERVKRWTRHVDIFEKDFLGHVRSYGEIAANIRGYLSVEWRSRRDSVRKFTDFNLPLYAPLSPQQTNNSDCGVFVLLNLESFFASPPNFGEPVLMDRVLFSAEDVVLKRASMSDLILELHTRQHPESEFAATWRARQAATGLLHTAHGTVSTEFSRASSPVPALPEHFTRENSPDALRRSGRKVTPARQCHLPGVL